jgi:2-polyprenyl-3-methyl-5-hydroxy-6-metoxy-1,4-benzoquinol methylase
MDSSFANNFVPAVADALEQLSLQEIARRVRANAPPLVLDVPCGDGHHVVAMARLGAHVLAGDRPEHENAVCGRALAAGVKERVDFAALQPGDAQRLPGPFDIVFCHHGIHRLPYAEARQAVRGLVRAMRIGGKLFISAYGLHSALGDAYADQEKPVEQRFAHLAPAVAEAYHISGPVCLYTERNLVTLLFEAGASVIKTFTSTHGTVKGVAVRV